QPEPVHGTPATPPLPGPTVDARRMDVAPLDSVLRHRRPESALVVLRIPRLSNPRRSCGRARVSPDCCDDSSGSVVHPSEDCRVPAEETLAYLLRDPRQQPHATRAPTGGRA